MIGRSGAVTIDFLIRSLVADSLNAFLKRLAITARFLAVRNSPRPLFFVFLRDPFPAHVSEPASLRVVPKLTASSSFRRLVPTWVFGTGHLFFAHLFFASSPTGQNRVTHFLKANNPIRQEYNP